MCFFFSFYFSIFFLKIKLSGLGAFSRFVRPFNVFGLKFVINLFRLGQAQFVLRVRVRGRLKKEDQPEERRPENSWPPVPF